MTHANHIQNTQSALSMKNIEVFLSTTSVSVSYIKAYGGKTPTHARALAYRHAPVCTHTHTYARAHTH